LAGRQNRGREKEGHPNGIPARPRLHRDKETGKKRRRIKRLGDRTEAGKKRAPEWETSPCPRKTKLIANPIRKSQQTPKRKLIKGWRAGFGLLVMGFLQSSEKALKHPLNCQAGWRKGGQPQ
jgi:hypothetical protein